MIGTPHLTLRGVFHELYKEKSLQYIEIALYM